MRLEATEIRQAFEWTCENCGHDQFERIITLDPESDEAKELMSKEYARQRKAAGITADTIICMAPPEVECRICKARYRTIE